MPEFSLTHLFCDATSKNQWVTINETSSNSRRRHWQYPLWNKLRIDLMNATAKQPFKHRSFPGNSDVFKRSTRARPLRGLLTEKSYWRHQLWQASLCSCHDTEEFIGVFCVCPCVSTLLWPNSSFWDRTLPAVTHRWTTFEGRNVGGGETIINDLILEICGQGWSWGGAKILMIPRRTLWYTLKSIKVTTKHSMCVRVCVHGQCVWGGVNICVIRKYG